MRVVANGTRSVPQRSEQRTQRLAVVGEYGDAVVVNDYSRAMFPSVGGVWGSRVVNGVGRVKVKSAFNGDRFCGAASAKAQREGGAARMPGEIIVHWKDYFRVGGFVARYHSGGGIDTARIAAGVVTQCRLRTVGEGGRGGVGHPQFRPEDVPFIGERDFGHVREPDLATPIPKRLVPVNVVDCVVAAHAPVSYQPSERRGFARP